MYLREQLVSLLLFSFFSSTSMASGVNSGFDVYTAAQIMLNKAANSWEWGTAAEALLELFNNELSVFGGNPFPNGKIPQADPSTNALAYAKQFINRNAQVLVDNSAVGDPASLGVSAILLGQSDSTYIEAANRQADYLLNQAPKWSNGAISQRPDVAELWADNMAMSFPFLAYLAVQQNNSTLMAETVRQCGLQRDVLKASQSLNWQHVIGPQSQDTGLWSTGNGWAGYGMVRVLHTLQNWSGSSSLTSEANQLKGWIQEILDGALLSSLDNGLLHNYLDDDGWFGEISGTALLSAVAYRMAVNDPSMFPQKYIDWADKNRMSLSHQEGSDGVVFPAVNPYDWKDRNQYNNGSPEGQAFMVYMYTAYRDCLASGNCQPSILSPATTISQPGIGPIDIMTVFDHAITFSMAPAPTGKICSPTTPSCDSISCQGTFNSNGLPVCTIASVLDCPCTPTSNTCGTPQSCDLNNCSGAFSGLTEYPQCTGSYKGCQCTASATTCGAHQSCDQNGCAGAFTGLQEYAQCQGNFKGCECTATSNTCGAHQSCDLNGCAGAFTGLQKYPECMGNFKGCECSVTTNTCGPHQSCDLNGCAGAFDLSNGKAWCTGNFEGCECSATSNTCGTPLSCDMNNCDGGFWGNVPYPQCRNFFNGCECQATSNTCGAPQSCGINGCNGEFDLSNGIAYCQSNFYGCQCAATPATCGAPQSCDNNNCRGAFSGLVVVPECTGFFEGCVCTATTTTCGIQQSCDLNGCAGGYDSSGMARCQGNFRGCACKATSTTCGTAQNCDLNGCAGTFDSQSNTARCRGKFAGCVCNPVASTCGTPQACDINGCDGKLQSDGSATCTGNFYGCPCNAPASWTQPTPVPQPTPPSIKAVILISQSYYTLSNFWYFDWGVYDINGVFFPGGICNLRPLVHTSGAGNYPPTLPSFNIGPFTGCVYSGSSNALGTLTCSGNPPITCFQPGGSEACVVDNSIIFDYNIECYLYA